MGPRTGQSAASLTRSTTRRKKSRWLKIRDCSMVCSGPRSTSPLAFVSGGTGGNMFADILRIFTAVLTFNNRVVPHLNVQVYYRVPRLARIALGIIVGGFVLNLIGLKEVNLLLAILFAVPTANRLGPTRVHA